MLVLGIETSCDETSVALVTCDNSGKLHLIDQIVSSQIKHHQPFGGVVPEIATRQHLSHLPILAHQLMESTQTPWQSLQGIGVTRGPGLASSLMIGLSFAKGLALQLEIPWIGIDHLEGHLMSPFLGQSGDTVPPHCAIILSGGHTLIIDVPRIGTYKKIGGTRDDAVGEAFDKVAKMLNLGYPGGPTIERLARQGNPHAFDLPRAMLHSGNADMSLSGLKTAMRLLIQKEPNILQEERMRADVCASFQQAIIDVLLHKTRDALISHHRTCFTLSGGVSCNQAIRQAFQELAVSQGWQFHCASSHLSTDNAAMIASVAHHHLSQGQSSPWSEDIDPRLRTVNSSVWKRGM